MDRKAFLKGLVGGVAVAAAPGVLLVEPEPVRRYWQVPRGAPVGGRAEFERKLRLAEQAMQNATPGEMEQMLAVVRWPTGALFDIAPSSELPRPYKFWLVQPDKPGLWEPFWPTEEHGSVEDYSRTAFSLSPPRSGTEVALRHQLATERAAKMAEAYHQMRQAAAEALTGDLAAIAEMVRGRDA